MEMLHSPTACFVSDGVICGDVAQSTACFVSGVVILGDVAQSTARFVSGVFTCRDTVDNPFVLGVLFWCGSLKARCQIIV